MNHHDVILGEDGDKVFKIKGDHVVNSEGQLADNGESDRLGLRSSAEDSPSQSKAMENTSKV